MEELEEEIKQLIVDSLRLEGLSAGAIDPTAPLFVGGLGLDSIDALELALAIRKRYGVKASSDQEENRKIFASVRSLAFHVAQNRQHQVSRP